MKKITANNAAKAKAELMEVDKKIGENFDYEINENDKGHHVVIMVAQIHNEAKKKYETRITVQQFDQASFEKLQAEGALATLGYDKMIVLHKLDETAVINISGSAEEIAKKNQPQFLASPAAPATPAAPAETPEQMEERIKKDLEEKYAGYIPAPATPAAPAYNMIDPAKVDVSEYDVEKLFKFAEDNKVDVTGLTEEKALRTAITTWQKAAAKAKK